MVSDNKFVFSNGKKYILMTGKIWLLMFLSLFIQRKVIKWSVFMTEFQTDKSNPDMYMSPNSSLGLIQNSLLAISWKWLVSAFACIYLYAPPSCRVFTCLLWNLSEWTPLSSCFWCFYMYSNPKDIAENIYHSNILFPLFICSLIFDSLTNLLKLNYF